MIVRLLSSASARTPRHLKTIIYGGAPMYVADSLRAIDLFGPRLYQLYGQGEAPMTITGLPQELHSKKFVERLSTCGFARTGVEVKIFDDKDQQLPAGEVGEIVTRSDCVMAGYWENPDATATTLRSGWLHTGDVGSMDEAGFLTIKDRSKDMIISGGANIYPREIEEVLLRHPAVAECSVVGRPHPEWGEEVVAFIVSKDHVSPEDLPKNHYGKVLKTELRAQLAYGLQQSLRR
jgi:acyl-CoA synthetase (AMP-forming)/AMP-acid ligase II